MPIYLFRMVERKVFVLVNPNAGKNKVVGLANQFRSFIEAQNLAFELHDTSASQSATTTVAEMLDSTFSELVILGGDGTINEAINGLKHDVPVAILPAGTGDDFAKNIDIGKTKRDQFETAINGKNFRIDLGLCNDRKFVNGVGIGFDGQIVEDMASKRVPLLKGHAAYYYHVLRILGGYREKPFEYNLDNQDFERDLILLTVANGTTFGGGFRLTPKAKIDDGLLDVCAIRKLPAIHRFLNIHRLSKGTHDQLNAVSFHQVRSVEIRENSQLFAHIDGERMGQPPFEIKILPQSMILRVIRSS